MTRVTKIADIADVVRGVTFAKSDADTEPAPGKLPVLRAGNIGEQLILGEGLVFVDKERINPSQLLQPNDIVMCTSSGSAGLVGKSATLVSPWKGSFGAFCAVIRTSPIKADASFLSHFLRSPAFRQWASGSSGIGIKNIRASDLKNFKVPLPPLEEQKRIAAILDQADSLRRSRQRAIVRLDSFIQAAFLTLFGDPVTNPMCWEEKAFEDIVINTKLGLVRSSEEFGWNFTTPYVRMDALTRDGKFLPEKVQFTEATEREMATHALKAGDFLFNTRNSRELVGKVCVFDGPSGWVFNNNLMRIRFKRDIEPNVIACQFQFDHVRRELESRKSGTTSVFAVYWNSLKSLPVLVPETGLQRHFASVVESANLQKINLQNHLKTLNMLFSSLQHRAFRGEL